jgi:glycosyltransferase involved in cell wall biosynthesis
VIASKPKQESAGPMSRADRERVLVIANRLPYPLDDGWKRRTFHLVRSLAERAPLTLASLHDGPANHVAELAELIGHGARVETVRPFRWRGPLSIALGLATPLPYHVWRQRSGALDALVRTIIARERPTVGLATLAHLYPYLRHLPPEATRVIDTHNIDSLVLRRYADSMWRGPRALYARMTARKLARHERDVFAAADIVWVCSDEERRLLDGTTARRVEVVPNGVDTFGDFADKGVPVVANRILFFGKLDYHPNSDAVRWFLDEIFPTIRALRPDVEFLVVGPGADADLQGRIERTANTKLMGWVPELADLVASAAVVVVPLRAGGGTRLKILEALSLGRPLVSTTVGAEGLALVSGHDLILADAPADFAAQVVSLLDGPAEARTLGRAGREAVRARYDWTRMGDQIAEMLRIA